MKKQRTMLLQIVAILLLVFSTSLIVIGSYSLSNGSSTTTSIICILSGSILALGDVFLVLSLYLPFRKKRLALRNAISKSMDELSTKQKRSDED